MLGCFIFGTVVVNNSTDCRISKQYLCQAALFMTGVSILAFTSVEGYNGYVVFVWIFGVFSGGYHYSLKMYIYEKVRARNFARAWGFAQFAMAVPNFVGVPITGYINAAYGGGRAGYYFSSVMVVLGSVTMVLIDVHKRHLRQRKLKSIQRKKMVSEANSIAAPDPVPSVHVTAKDGPSQPGELTIEEQHKASFAEQEDILPAVALLAGHHSLVYEDDEDLDLKKPELTIYSEEGIADMDLPDNILLEDLDYLDNITSCNKVENCVMLSEYEQNLIKETEGPTGPRRARKWSLFRQPTLQTIHSEDEDLSMTIGVGGVDTRPLHHQEGASVKPKSFLPNTSGPPRAAKVIPTFSRGRFSRHHPKRSITVIEETSM